MRALIPIVVLIMSIPLMAQETRPERDLAKENRELKEYVERLEKRLGELESRSQAERDQRFDLQRRYFEPFSAPLPRSPEAKPFPWRMQPPTTRPAPTPLAPAPPRDWHRFRFNGQDVYVIPLRTEDQ
jgi:hypothetical protein